MALRYISHRVFSSRGKLNRVVVSVTWHSISSVPAGARFESPLGSLVLRLGRCTSLRQQICYTCHPEIWEPCPEFFAKFSSVYDSLALLMEVYVYFMT